MALPISNTPIYSLTIPSSESEFKFRPFLVKEQKTLLLAQQSEDITTMVNSLKDVIKSCAKSDININELTTFDLEYIFTQMRAKSVGENIELFFKCDVDHGEDNEKAKIKVNIDLTKIEVQKSETHTKNIKLFDDVGVIMKYPDLNLLKIIENVNGTNVDELFKLIIPCIDQIYNSNEVFHIKEQSNNDVVDFLNNLTTDQFNKIQEFFTTMPKMVYNVEYTCPVCNKLHKETLEGLQNFF